jgi:hypothetical protein
MIIVNESIDDVIGGVCSTLEIRKVRKFSYKVFIGNSQGERPFVKISYAWENIKRKHENAVHDSGLDPRGPAQFPVANACQKSHEFSGCIE